MVNNNCSLCAAGSKVEEVSGVFRHVVENMSDDGRPQHVICENSPIKPTGWLVAPKID